MTPLLAGIVFTLPSGIDRVALLSCDPAPCSSFATSWWNDNHPEPTVLLDAVLDRDGGAWAGGETWEVRFRGALAAGRDALATGDPRAAESSLERAAHALSAWDGPATTQEVFDLWYLLGAARLGVGNEAPPFRQAAASAWNRVVTPPVDDPAARAAYAMALRELLAEPPAILTFGSAPGTSWTVDGVDVGGRPLFVHVLPGEHRVTTSDGRTAWARTVYAPAGETVVIEAELSAFDPDAFREAFGAVVRERAASAEWARYLRDWARFVGVREVRLIHLQEGSGRSPFREQSAVLRVASGSIVGG